MEPAQNQNPAQTPMSSKPQMSHFLRNILIVLGFILAVFVVIDILFIFNNLTKNINTTISTQKSLENQINLSLKKEYENPFDKKTQYVNPFSQSQNPFDNLTQ